jgi:lipoprotein-anchoring transpeptidase ErfK/SrfK
LDNIGQQHFGELILISRRTLLGAAVSFAGFSGSALAAGHPVTWKGEQEPGTIIILTEQRRLYLVTAPGEARSYPIAVGKEGAQWIGTTRVVRKAKDPDWRPTASMRAKNPKLPEFVKGGPGNPLGARALYLDEGYLRIHGNNDESSIGFAKSSGCYRMYNEDVIELYDLVQTGSTVIVAE